MSPAGAAAAADRSIARGIRYIVYTCIECSGRTRAARAGAARAGRARRRRDGRGASRAAPHAVDAVDVSRRRRTELPGQPVAAVPEPTYSPAGSSSVGQVAMDDAGNCHRVRTPRRSVTTNTAYGTPRTELEATLGAARRVPYSTALEVMRGQNGQLPRRAEPLVQLTQSLAANGSARGSGALPPLRVSPPDSSMREGHSAARRVARTGGLYCPGEDSAVQQMWSFGSWGKQVWLPVNRGALTDRAAHESRHAPARAAVDVVGSGSTWTGLATVRGSRATVRGVNSLVAESQPVLASLRCVTSVASEG